MCFPSSWAEGLARSLSEISMTLKMSRISQGSHHLATCLSSFNLECLQRVTSGLECEYYGFSRLALLFHVFFDDDMTLL